MKFLAAFLLVVVLSVFCPSSQAAKICVSHVETCKDNVPVCGRFGGSDLCMNFKNRCAFEIFNCASTTPYKIVNSNMCTGIPLNTRTFCKGLPNGPVVCKGKKCGGIKGGNIGGVDIQPIIINAGK